MRRVAVVLIAALLAACGSDQSVEGPAVALDGSPRHADVAGRVVALADDFSTITIDDQVLELAENVVSFSALDASLHPLVQWRNQYVQAGLADGEVVWVGGIGAVVDLPGQPQVVYFTDVLTDLADGEATLRSGTVLPVDDGVRLPSDPPVAVVVTIDVDSDRVVTVEPG